MESIKNYLVNERNMKSELAAKISSNFANHDDIRAELITVIEGGEYPQDKALKVEGYTAQDISKLAPFMNAVGVYNFMITLRERPENGKKIIADGFPRK